MIRRKVTTKKDVVSEKQIQILKIPYNKFESIESIILIAAKCHANWGQSGAAASTQNCLKLVDLKYFSSYSIPYSWDELRPRFSDLQNSFFAAFCQDSWAEILCFCHQSLLSCLKADKIVLHFTIYCSVSQCHQ